MQVGQTWSVAGLSGSTLNFKTADELADKMTAAGFQEMGYKKMMFGTVAVHWGTKKS